MKKVVAFLLSAVMTFAALGCGGEKKEDTSSIEVKDAVEILTTAWDNFDEANRFYASGGGYNNMVEDAPGAVDVTDTDSLTVLLAFPEAYLDQIDDAASLIHGMNANTFTATAYHVTDSSNVQALADGLKDSIMNKQWMCGFPEIMFIASIGEDYVVSCIGNTDLVNEFKDQIVDAYGANMIYEESIM